MLCGVYLTTLVAVVAHLPFGESFTILMTLWCQWSLNNTVSTETGMTATFVSTGGPTLLAHRWGGIAVTLLMTLEQCSGFSSTLVSVLCSCAM